jgi:hypothetical protein
VVKKLKQIQLIFGGYISFKELEAFIKRKMEREIYNIPI